MPFRKGVHLSKPMSSLHLAPPLRSFICIEFPAALHEYLRSLQARIPTFPHVKLTHPHGAHLTLRFMGNLSPEAIQRVSDASASTAAQATPFAIDIGPLGAFPSTKRPRVLWLGVGSGAERLEKLHQVLERELEARGFRHESKPFKPHLTVARVKSDASNVDFRRLSGVFDDPSFRRSSAAHEIKSITTMNSELTRTGPRYTVYSRHRFAVSL